jgi:hypothetical protein
MWKGTAATLKAKPAATRTMPQYTSSRCSPRAGPSVRLSSDRFVVPVAPYSSAAPYSSTAEEKAPRMKYLKPASLGRVPRRRYEASA